MCDVRNNSSLLPEDDKGDCAETSLKFLFRLLYNCQKSQFFGFEISWYTRSVAITCQKFPVEFWKSILYFVRLIFV